MTSKRSCDRGTRDTIRGAQAYTQTGTLPPIQTAHSVTHLGLGQRCVHAGGGAAKGQVPGLVADVAHGLVGALPRHVPRLLAVAAHHLVRARRHVPGNPRRITAT